MSLLNGNWFIIHVHVLGKVFIMLGRGNPDLSFIVCVCVCSSVCVCVCVCVCVSVVLVNYNFY